MAVRLLYFAWVRERIGTGEEALDVPDALTTVSDLIGWLAGRSAGHAAALADPGRLRAAVDQRFVGFDASIVGAREVAFFPPVTGGMIEVAVQPEDFSADAVLDRLRRLGGGGIASFVGIVRDEDGVEELFLDHYPGMTETALHGLAEVAAARWNLLGAVVIHRVGALRPSERIVLVATCAPHRRDALEACAALIDRLKTDAPFWKRERRGGEARWVEPRPSDIEAGNDEGSRSPPSPRA